MASSLERSSTGDKVASNGCGWGRVYRMRRARVCAGLRGERTAEAAILCDAWSCQSSRATSLRAIKADQFRFSRQPIAGSEWPYYTRLSWENSCRKLVDARWQRSGDTRSAVTHLTEPRHNRQTGSIRLSSAAYRRPASVMEISVLDEIITSTALPLLSPRQTAQCI